MATDTGIQAGYNFVFPKSCTPSHLPPTPSAATLSPGNQNHRIYRFSCDDVPTLLLTQASSFRLINPQPSVGGVLL